MQKIKFDFEATKERIYAPNSNVPIGAPVDRNGNIANDGNAYGIVLCKETENEKYWVRYNLVVMVAGYCDIIDAQAIWGDEYSAEAIAAMSDIIFCDDHKIGGGGGWPSDLPKPSVGGYGYTEQGEQTVIVDESVTTEGTALVFGNFSDFFSLKIGGEYSVIFNGSKYDTIGVDAGHGAVSIGAEFAEEDSDFSVYPFIAMCSAGDEHPALITQSAGTYAITISESSDTIHKIDEKYLPASGGAMVVTFTVDEDYHVTSDKTADEIIDAASKGVNVIGNVFDSDYPVFEHLILVGANTDDVNKSISFVKWHIFVNSETHTITQKVIAAITHTSNKWSIGVDMD